MAAWPVNVAVLACPPVLNRLRDIGNLIKQLEDALVLAGVMIDDSQIDAEAIYRGNPDGVGAVHVSIDPYDPDAAAVALEVAGLKWATEGDLF